MPTKPLDRLMFVQGGRCFFCRKELQNAEASVEHLFASAKGGSNGDDNCVACCKSVNALLGSMSLKEKFQVVLNQQGQFRCPNSTTSARAKEQAQAAAVANAEVDKVAFVLANLKQRGTSRPRTLKTLTSTTLSLFPKGISEAELAALLQQLQATRKIIVNENAVTYAL